VTAFLALVGPTASGKTALSFSVAKALDAEIISVDSRQVYRGMDIGTAKVSRVERADVPHHGLDLVDPDQRYSAGHFARDVRRWIGEIRGRGRVPLLVGGTGFFLRTLYQPMFAEPPMDASRVERLRRYLNDQPRARLEAWVRHLDPDRAPLALSGGTHRISRTLEVALLSGRPLSQWHRETAPEGQALRGLTILLEVPRAELYRRVGERVRQMVKDGFLGEVQGLLDRGFGVDAPGMTGTGYREVAGHLRGETTLEEAMDDVDRNTRRYARRQITWFRHQLPPDTVRIDAMAPLAEQVKATLEAWKRALTEEVG